MKPTLTYSCESWLLRERRRWKLNSVRTKFLRMQETTKQDEIINKIFRKRLKITSVEEMAQEKELKWLGHVCRM